MARSRAQRRAARRAASAERVKPSAMAEAKKRPWPMQELLRLGPEKGGIDAEQFEAGVQIVEARQALTRHLDFPSRSILDYQPECGGDRNAEMSPRDERLTTVYLAWGRELTDRLGVKADQVAAWVSAVDRPPALLMLTRALDLWGQARDDHDRAAKARRETVSPNLAQTPPEGHSCPLGGERRAAGPEARSAPDLTRRADMPHWRVGKKRSV